MEALECRHSSVQQHPQTSISAAFWSLFLEGIKAQDLWYQSEQPEDLLVLDWIHFALNFIKGITNLLQSAVIIDIMVWHLLEAKCSLPNSTCPQMNL